LLILKIDRQIYKSFVDIVSMSFYMDLCHIGIHWKTVVDQETLDDPVSNCSVPYTDFTHFIMKYILKR